MKPFRKYGRGISRRSTALVALVAAVLALGIGVAIHSQTASAGSNASIEVQYTDAGDLVVDGTGFAASTTAKATEVLTAVSLDTGTPLTAKVTSDSTGSFTQKFDLPDGYVGSIGVASVTSTASATSAIVIDK